MLPRLHIYTPPGTYQVRVREFGHQKYILVGQSTRHYKTALRRLADAMAGKAYKRGDILWCTEWHEPHVVCELVAR